MENENTLEVAEPVQGITGKLVALEEISHELTTDNDGFLYIDGEAFEDYYLSAFLLTQSKRKSYIQACHATGYELPKYPNQAAYTYHKRLDATGKVTAALDKAVELNKIASMNKLNYLRENATSETIQYQAAKTTSGDLYTQDTHSAGITVNVNRDNVKITHKNQSLTISEQESEE